MPRIKTRILFGLLALTLLATLSSGQQSPPDLILLNGKIFTSDSAHPFVEALVIRGERIGCHWDCGKGPDVGRSADETHGFKWFE